MCYTEPLSYSSEAGEWWQGWKLGLFKEHSCHSIQSTPEGKLGFYLGTKGKVCKKGTKKHLKVCEESDLQKEQL